MLTTIKLSPQRRDDPVPEITVDGNSVFINGDEIDFTELPLGSTYPNGNDLSEWIAGEVSRDENGDVTLTVILPHGPNPREDQAFPEPAILDGDGLVLLPQNSEPEEGYNA